MLRTNICFKITSSRLSIVHTKASYHHTSMITLSVILHGLDRRTNSAKFSAESVHDVDKENGIFEVEKTSGGRHTVNFGILNADNMPSCTCKDWVRHHLPCKHFFSVFMHRKDWPWEKLPHVYLNSAYLSTDMQALCRHFSIPTQNSSDMDSGDTESY